MTLEVLNTTKMALGKSIGGGGGVECLRNKIWEIERSGHKLVLSTDKKYTRK